MISELEKQKNHTDDRILILKPKEGKTALSSTGTPDARLFTGENVVHIRKGIDLLWSCQYTAGNTPPALKNKFTSFTKALNYAKQYFDRRNIEVVEVQDA